jgi:hypothetical protein
MRTWNDTAQYQMLYDILNFINISLIVLLRELISSWKAETIVGTPALNDIATIVKNIGKRDFANFLLHILHI